MKACPACGREVEVAAASCAFCHVIFAKHKPRGAEDGSLGTFNQDLQRTGALVVQQQR